MLHPESGRSGDAPSFAYEANLSQLCRQEQFRFAAQKRWADYKKRKNG
jgi:hypothetical protein